MVPNTPNFENEESTAPNDVGLIVISEDRQTHYT